jgi:hypothetical protein
MPKLNENEIVEQWSVLIEGAQGRQKEFYELITDRLDELQPPRLDVSQKEVYATLFKRLKGDKKKFLLIKSKYFDGYVLNVYAEDYGNQLLIAWYLTQRPSKFLQFIVKLPDLLITILYPVWLLLKLYDKITNRRISLENMDIFDRQELSAFAGTIHHAVTHGSEVISNTVGFDFSRVDQKSKGFLNLT